MRFSRHAGTDGDLIYLAAKNSRSAAVVSPGASSARYARRAALWRQRYCSRSAARCRQGRDCDCARHHRSHPIEEVPGIRSCGRPRNPWCPSPDRRRPRRDNPRKWHEWSPDCGSSACIRRVPPGSKKLKPCFVFASFFSMNQSGSTPIIPRASRMAGY